MECAPTAREAVVSVAMPEESSVPVPRLAAPSRNVTVPVGMPAGELTVAVKVTGWPKTDGFAEDTRAVVVAGLITVNLAALEVALPAELLNTAWYKLPFCDKLAVNVSVVRVAPAILLKLTPPSVLTCHWTVGAGVPVAAAVNEAVCPAVIVRLDGDVVTAAATKIWRTKIWNVPFVTPKLLAADWKANAVRSGEKFGSLLELLPGTPLASVDARVTAPVVKSLMKTCSPLLPPGTRFVAADSKAISMPSGENTASWLVLPFASTPLASLETRVSAPVVRSLTKISRLPVDKSELELKATFVPSGENMGSWFGPLNSLLLASVEARVMAPVTIF